MHTLSKHGELVPDTAAKEFEEGINEHIEAGVRQVAKMALDQREKEDEPSRDSSQAREGFQVVSRDGEAQRQRLADPTLAQR